MATTEQTTTSPAKSYLDILYDQVGHKFKDIKISDIPDFKEQILRKIPDSIGSGKDELFDEYLKEHNIVTLRDLYAHFKRNKGIDRTRPANIFPYIMDASDTVFAEPEIKNYILEKSSAATASEAMRLISGGYPLYLSGKDAAVYTRLDSTKAAEEHENRILMQYVDSAVFHPTLDDPNLKKLNLSIKDEQNLFSKIFTPEKISELKSYYYEGFIPGDKKTKLISYINSSISRYLSEQPEGKISPDTINMLKGEFSGILSYQLDSDIKRYQNNKDIRYNYSEGHTFLSVEDLLKQGLDFESKNGTFEFRVGNFMDALFANEVTSDNRIAAAKAINKALGVTEDDATIAQYADNKEKFTEKLTTGINGHDKYKPYNLEDLLKDADEQNPSLPDNNPLKTYNRHKDNQLKLYNNTDRRSYAYNIESFLEQNPQILREKYIKALLGRTYNSDAFKSTNKLEVTEDFLKYLEANNIKPDGLKIHVGDGYFEYSDITNVLKTARERLAKHKADPKNNDPLLLTDPLFWLDPLASYTNFAQEYAQKYTIERLSPTINVLADNIMNSKEPLSLVSKTLWYLDTQIKYTLKEITNGSPQMTETVIKTPQIDYSSYNWGLSEDTLKLLNNKALSLFQDGEVTIGEVTNNPVTFGDLLGKFATMPASKKEQAMIDLGLNPKNIQEIVGLLKGVGFTLSDPDIENKLLAPTPQDKKAARDEARINK